MTIATILEKVALELSYFLTIIASPPHQKPIKTEMGGAQTLKSVGVVMETNELSQNLTRVPGLKNKLSRPFVNPTLVTTNVTVLGSTEQTPHPKVDTPTYPSTPKATTTVQTVQLRRPSRLASYDDLLTTTIQTIQLRRPSRLTSYDDQLDHIATTTQLRRPSRPRLHSYDASYDDQLDHIVTMIWL